MSRLVSTKQLLEAYKRKTHKTLISWTKREENPLPKPVSGGQGQGSQYLWIREELIEWELKEFGCEIDM